MKPESKVGASPKGRKKTRGPKKKTKKDPNEPQKPISAYALFFRDTQAVIKRQNPNATFGEVSKIVASMWDSLDPDAKNVYKEKTDAAKKEYAKALAAYRASLTEKEELNHCEDITEDVEPASPGVEPSAPAASPPQVQVLESPTHSKEPPLATLDEIVQPVDETPAELPEATLTEQKSPQPVIDISASSEEQDANGENEPNITNGIVTEEAPICLRKGCTNPVVDSPEWDQEYCSSKCVVEHCSAVFMAHVTARQKNIIEIS